MAAQAPPEYAGFLDLPAELRNTIYALIQRSWPAHSTTLHLTHLNDPLTRAQIAVRGTVAFAQTCRQVRGEWLPILTSNIHAIHVFLDDAVSFLHNVVLQDKPIGSVLLSASSPCKLDVDIPFSKYDAEWENGVDILPLLKAVARAANVQPEIDITLRNAEYSSHFFTHMECLFKPRPMWMPRRDVLFASVEQMLVRRGTLGYLLLVLKPGVGPIDTIASRKALMRRLGLRAGLDSYVRLGHLDEMGNAVGLVHVNRQRVEVGMHRTV